MTNNTPKRSRSEQARINGANSKGPTSFEGKAISSRNSLRHGFAAAVNNVIVIEHKEAFDRHVAGYRASLSPCNYLEETLIDQLASINWRQTRLVALETAIIDAQISLHKDAVEEFQPAAAPNPYVRLVFAWQALSRKYQTPEDPAALTDTFDINCLELVRRYITTLDRQYRNTLLNLRQYRKDFAEPQQPTPTPNEPKNPTAKAPEQDKSRRITPLPISPKPVIGLKPTLVRPEKSSVTKNPESHEL